MTDCEERLEELEGLVERQADALDRQSAVLDEYRETNERLRARIDDLESGSDLPVDRRSVLQAGGVLAALGLGVGTASAQSDPTGQVGTADRPIETLYADGLSGPLTGGEELDSLVGDGLVVQNNELTSTAAGLDTPTLSIDSIDLTDTFENESLSVGVTVEETEGLLTDDLNVTLTVSGEAGSVDNESVDIADLQGGTETASTTVTFGEGGTGPGLEPLDPGDYTVTVTANARNAPATTASDEFSVVPVEFAGGDGTEQDPYQIETWHHLHDVRDVPDREFVLVADLDENTAGYGGDGENDVVLGADGDPVDGNGFEPIGTDSYRFTGTFDGNGHTITGLTIERSDEDYVGLFGAAGSGATIENVGLEAVDVSGDSRVGGLVGENRGTVKRSYATGSVSGSSVGGLVSWNNNTGTVSTSYWDVPATDQGDSAGDGVTGIGSTADDQPADGMVGDDLDGDLENDFDFQNVWETVDAENDSDADADDYPVLQTLDRAAQLEARA